MIFMMSSKRVSLHGIDPREKSSPLKKQLGELTSKDGNILGDGDYVDVELETVLTNKPRKRRKTVNVLANTSSGNAAQNDNLLPTCSDEISKGSSEINFDAITQEFSSQLADGLECTTEDFSHEGQDDCDTLARGDSELNIAASNEFLEIEASNGEYQLAFYINVL